MKTLHFAKNIMLSNLRRLRAPYKVMFALTYRCNFQCRICNIWKKEKRDELTSGEIQRFFTANNAFSWVNLTGGEIFTRDDIAEILTGICKKCRNLYLLNFPTNGWFTKRIVDSAHKVLQLKPKKFIVNVSIDGPPEVHDTLKGTKGAWEHAIETLKSLRKMRSRHFSVYAGMTLSPFNFNMIEETYSALKKEIPQICFDDFHFNIAHTSPHFYANTDIDVAMDNQMLKQVNVFAKQKRGVSAAGWLKARYLRHCRTYMMTGKSPLPCQAFSASVFVDPYGDIYPCSLWDKKIANLKDINFDLSAIWRNPEAAEVRTKIRGEGCPGCWSPCEAYQSVLGNIFSGK